MKAVIFDCYGVLCESVGNAWFTTHMTNANWRESEGRYCHDLDWGTMSDDEFFGVLATAVNRPKEEVKEEWLALIIPNEDVLTIARELKEKYQIAVCSNAGSWFFKETMQRSGMATIFDTLVVSSELKLAKPDPRIYAYMLERLGSAPSETVFIDDSPKNVEAAAAVGMHALLFTDALTLRRDLAALGIS